MRGPKPSASLPDFTGRVLDNGRYHLTRLLGKGAFGAVYRAVDLQASATNDPSPHRAIKILRKRGASPARARTITREFQLHRSMASHPNIVTLHRAFEDKEFVYLVLDYCEGGTLFHQICNEGVYWRDDELLRKVYLQLIDAVFACHQRHVFHRDLKPENILVSEDGSIPYLADFGLATNERIGHSFGCGSSLFMSPGKFRLYPQILVCGLTVARPTECIGIEKGMTPYSTSHSDIWSLGIILVNMITARSPWAKALTTNDSYSEFLVNPDMLREQLPISEGAAAIIISLLDATPTERLTLTSLREAIVGLDTFFMTDEEVMHAGPCVQFIADSFKSKAKWRKLEEGKPDISPRMVRTRYKNKKYLAGVSESPLLPNLLGHPAPRPATPSPASAPPSDIAQRAINVPADIATSSTAASKGPVTPETHAIEVAVVVSELELEGGIGEAVEITQKQAGPAVVVNCVEPVSV